MLFNFYLVFVIGNGDLVYGQTVIITTGTFLRANINIGLESRPAGRMGDEPSIGLAVTLENAGFKLGRLKTGNFPINLIEVKFKIINIFLVKKIKFKYFVLRFI